MKSLRNYLQEALSIKAQRETEERTPEVKNQTRLIEEPVPLLEGGGEEILRGSEEAAAPGRTPLAWKEPLKQEGEL